MRVFVQKVLSFTQKEYKAEIFCCDQTQTSLITLEKPEFVFLVL